MFKPLDLLVRIMSIPSIAWSASGSILAARHRIAETLAREGDDSVFTQHVFDGLFDRIEGQCRSRWVEGFACAVPDPATQADEDDEEARAA